MGGSHIHNGSERSHIICKGGHIFTEPVDNGIHKRIVADQFYFAGFALEHPESGVDIRIDIKAFRCRSGFLIKNLRVACNSIHTEVSKPPFVIVDSNHIVIITIPYKMKRCNHIGFSIMAELLLLADIVLEVCKRDFLLLIDCRVDGIDNHEDFVVICLDSTLNGDISFQLLSLVKTAKSADLFN